MTSPLSSRLRAALDQQRRANQLRELETVRGPQGREIEINGKRLINFCSNDYLGLCNHPELKAAARDAIASYGVGSGAAQLLSGRSEQHQLFEQELTEYLGYEAALIYSSGYLANLGILSGLLSRQDVVHHDKLNHASLIDGVKLSQATSKRYRHLDVAALAANLQRYEDRQQWVVTDGVFSMDGDIAPLPEISLRAQQTKATLIVDDAHGFGVLANGRGTGAHYGLTMQQVPILIVTFGKALGTHGAAVLGEKDLIEYLVQKSRTFIYDTALPAANMASSRAALQLLRSTNLVEELDSKVALFKQLCREANLAETGSTSAIQPLLMGSEERAIAASAYLRDKGFYVRAVRPPTVPRGTSRLRVCLSCDHRADDIELLVTTIGQFLENDRS